MKARLAKGPDWDAIMAWLALSSVARNSAVMALWVAVTAGCCHPLRVVGGPSSCGAGAGNWLLWGRSASCGGDQPCWCKCAAAACAAWRDGGAWVGSWSPASSLAAMWVAWRVMVGSVSAHDAQKAAGERLVADSKPRPPCAKGKCARASAGAGSGPHCSSAVRARETARSWSCANAVTEGGGKLRRT